MKYYGVNEMIFLNEHIFIVEKVSKTSEQLHITLHKFQVMQSKSVLNNIISALNSAILFIYV